MKKIFLIMVFFTQILFVTNAFSSTYMGKVSSINIREVDGLVWVDIIGSRSGDLPSCAKDRNYMMIKNENSATGKRQLALLMMAQASNKTVKIDGMNTCTRWGDGEDIGTVQIQKN